MSSFYQWARWLPVVLRAEGIRVIVEHGWATRGLSRTMPFQPKFIVWHHDASPKGPTPGVPAAMIERFNEAAAQCWVCMGCNGDHPIGTWHIIAAGRAPHAGEVLRGKPNNFNSIGIETDHTSGESWHPDLLSSLRKGSAAILQRLSQTPDPGLEFHKTICAPPGRKIDPDGLELAAERVKVAQVQRLPFVDLSRVRVAAKGQRGFAPVSTERVQRALMDQGLLRRPFKLKWYGRRTKAAYAKWQESLGYSGQDANGVPGLESLTVLGRGRFVVRP